MELDEKNVNVVEQRGRLLAQVVEHVPFATLAIYFEHADPAAVEWPSRSRMEVSV